MLMGRAHLGQSTAATTLVPLQSILKGDYAACGNAGGVMDANGNCLPNPAMAPGYSLTPGLPQAYNPATGTVSESNTTGITQDVSTTVLAANTQLEAACLAAGGSWSPDTGCTAAPAAPTIPPVVYIVGGVLAVVLILSLKR